MIPFLVIAKLCSSPADMYLNGSLILGVSSLLGTSCFSSLESLIPTYCFSPKYQILPAVSKAIVCLDPQAAIINLLSLKLGDDTNLGV